MTSLEWFALALTVFGLLAAFGYSRWLNRTADCDTASENVGLREADERKALLLKWLELLPDDPDAHFALLADTRKALGL